MALPEGIEINPKVYAHHDLGNFKTRSAMILRCISPDPPYMVALRERRNKPNIGELVVLLNRKSSDNKVFLAIRKRLAYKIADLNPNWRTLAYKEFPSIY